jgi:hypothetical protein
MLDLHRSGDPRSWLDETRESSRIRPGAHGRIQWGAHGRIHWGAHSRILWVLMNGSRRVLTDTWGRTRSAHPPSTRGPRSDPVLAVPALGHGDQGAGGVGEGPGGRAGDTRGDGAAGQALVGRDTIPFIKFEGGALRRRRPSPTPARSCIRRSFCGAASCHGGGTEPPGGGDLPPTAQSVYPQELLRSTVSPRRRRGSRRSRAPARKLDGNSVVHHLALIRPARVRVRKRHSTSRFKLTVSSVLLTRSSGPSKLHEPRPLNGTRSTRTNMAPARGTGRTGHRTD